MPRTVKEIEQAVEQLTQDQLAEFRAWYEKFDLVFAEDRGQGAFASGGNGDAPRAWFRSCVPNGLC